MAALAERLVPVWARTLRGSVRRAEERQPLQHRIALISIGTGKDQRVEIARLQGKFAYHSELRAWDAFHGLH